MSSPSRSRPRHGKIDTTSFADASTSRWRGYRCYDSQFFSWRINGTILAGCSVAVPIPNGVLIAVSKGYTSGRSQSVQKRLRFRSHEFHSASLVREFNNLLGHHRVHLCSFFGPISLGHGTVNSSVNPSLRSFRNSTTPCGRKRDPSFGRPCNAEVTAATVSLSRLRFGFRPLRKARLQNSRRLSPT